MKLISFFLTTPQFKDGSKTVTRRLGWRNLKPGEHLMAVRKAQGLRKGEKVKRLGIINVKSVSRVRLNSITKRDCVREGFPKLTPNEFVEMFCSHMKCRPNKMVTRISFEKIRLAHDAKSMRTM